MTKSVSHPDYPAFLAELKTWILHARTNAARAVNRELVLLYWDIGRGIVEKQQKSGWGDAVVERLAADLRAEFPDLRGFSVSNLWRMKQLYLDHTSPEFLAQAVRELKKLGGHFLRQPVAEIILPDPINTRPGQTSIHEQPVQESSSSPAFGHQGLGSYLCPFCSDVRP